MLAKMVVTVSDVDQLILGHIAEQRYITTRNSLFEESPHLPEKIPLLSVFADISSENRLQSILEEYVGLKTGLLKPTCKKCTERTDSIEHMWDNFDGLVSEIKAYYKREEPQTSTTNVDSTTVPEMRAKSPSEINNTGRRSRRCFGMSPNVQSSSLRIVPLTMYEPLGLIQKKHIDPVSSKYVKYCRENIRSDSREEHIAAGTHSKAAKEKSTANLNEEASRRKTKKVMPRKLTEQQRQKRVWEQAEHAFDGDLSKLLNFPDNDALVVVGANIITNMKKCAGLSQKTGLSASPEKSQGVQSVTHVSPFKNPAVAEIDVNTLMTTEMREGLVEMTLESLLNSEIDVTSGFMNDEQDDEFNELKKLLDSNEIRLSDFADGVGADDHTGNQENSAEVTTSAEAGDRMEDVSWMRSNLPTSIEGTDCNNMDVSTSSRSKELTVPDSQPNLLTVSEHDGVVGSDGKDDKGICRYLRENITDTGLNVHCISSSSTSLSRSHTTVSDMFPKQSLSVTSYTDSLDLSSSHAISSCDPRPSTHGSFSVASQCTMPTGQCGLDKTSVDKAVHSENTDLIENHRHQSLNDSSSNITCSLSKAPSPSVIVSESVAVESNETNIQSEATVNHMTTVTQEPIDAMDIQGGATSCSNSSVSTSEILIHSPVTPMRDQHKIQTLQTTEHAPGTNIVHQAVTLHSCDVSQNFNSATSKNSDVQITDAISGLKSNLCEQVVPCVSVAEEMTVPSTSTVNYRDTNTLTHPGTSYTTPPVSYNGCSVVNSNSIFTSRGCTATVSSCFQLPSLIPIRCGNKQSFQNSTKSYYLHNTKDNNSMIPKHNELEVVQSPSDATSCLAQTDLETETIDTSLFKNCSSMPPKKRFLAIELDQTHSDCGYKVNKLKNLEGMQKTRSKSLDGDCHLKDDASLRRSCSTPARVLGVQRVSENIVSPFPNRNSSSTSLVPAQASVVCDSGTNSLSSAEDSCRNVQDAEMSRLCNTRVHDTENVANNFAGKMEPQKNKKKINGNTNKTPLRRSSRSRKPTQALLDCISNRKDASHSVRSITKVTNEKATRDNGNSVTVECSPNKIQTVPSTLLPVTKGIIALSNNERRNIVKKNVHVMKPGQGSVVINFSHKGRMPMHVQGIVVQPNTNNEKISRDEIIGQLVTQMKSKTMPKDSVCTGIPSPPKSQTCNDMTTVKCIVTDTSLPPVCSLSSHETFQTITEMQEGDPPPKTQQPILDTPLLSSTVVNSVPACTEQNSTLMPKSLLSCVSLTSTPPKYTYADNFSTISPSAGIFSVMAPSTDKKLDASKLIQLSAVAEYQSNLASVKSNLFDSFLREEKISSVETEIMSETQPHNTISHEHVMPLCDVKVSESYSEDITLTAPQSSVNTNTSSTALGNENGVVSSVMTQCISNTMNVPLVSSVKSSKILFHRSKKPLGTGSRSASQAKPRTLYLCNKLNNMSRIEPKKFSVPGVRRYYVPQTLASPITIVSPSTLSIVENTMATEPISYEELNKKTLLNSGSTETSTKPKQKLSAKKGQSKRKRKKKRRLKEGVKINTEPKQTTETFCNSLSDERNNNDAPPEKSAKCDKIERSDVQQVSYVSSLENGVKNIVDEGLQSSIGLDDPEMQNIKNLKSVQRPMWQTDVPFESEVITHEPDVKNMNEKLAFDKEKFYARDGFDISRIASESKGAAENEGCSTTRLSLGTEEPFKHISCANGLKDVLAGASISTVQDIVTSHDAEEKSGNGEKSDQSGERKILTFKVATDNDLTVDNIGECAVDAEIETNTLSNSTCGNMQHTYDKVADNGSRMNTGTVTVGTIDASKPTVFEKQSPSNEAKKQKRKLKMSDGQSKTKKRRLAKLMKSPIMNWSYEEIQAKLNLIHGEKNYENSNARSCKHTPSIEDYEDIRFSHSIKSRTTSQIIPNLNPDVFARGFTDSQAQKSPYSRRPSKVKPNNLLRTSQCGNQFSPRKSRISRNSSSDEKIFTGSLSENNAVENWVCRYTGADGTKSSCNPKHIEVCNSEHSSHTSASKLSQPKQTDFDESAQKKKQPRRVQLFPCDKISENLVPKSPFKPLTENLGSRHSPNTVQMVADSLVELSCGNREKECSGSKTKESTTGIHGNLGNKEMERCDPREGSGLHTEELCVNEPLDLSCSSWASEHLASDARRSRHNVDSRQYYPRESKGIVKMSKPFSPGKRLKGSQFSLPIQNATESINNRNQLQLGDSHSGNSSTRRKYKSSNVNENIHAMIRNPLGIGNPHLQDSQFTCRVKSQTSPSKKIVEQQDKQSFPICRLLIHESNREKFTEQHNEESNFYNKRLFHTGNKDSPCTKVDARFQSMNNPLADMSQLPDKSQHFSGVENNSKLRQHISYDEIPGSIISKKKKRKKKKTVVDLNKIDISKFLSSLKYDPVPSQ